MLTFVKQRVIEAGLPGHVVHMYLDQSTDRLTQRMKTIVRNALRSPQTTTQSTSTAIDATSTLIIDVAKEAQEAHKKMCEKAMDIMDSIKS